MSGYEYASLTLADILGNGASSGPKDISMDSGQAVVFIGSGVGGTSLKTNQTGAASRTINLPDLAADDVLVAENDPQTLTNKSFRDSTTFFIDEIDATKRMQFQLSGISTGQTRTLTVPNSSSTLATLTGTETLTAKTLTSPVINTPNLTGGTINNATIGATTATTGRFTNVSCVDTTNQIRTGAGANITTINCPASSGAVTVTLPNTTDTLIGRATTDTLTNKILSDTTTTFRNAADPTKILRFDLSVMNTGTTIVPQILPGTSGTLVLANGNQTITDKNLTDASNRSYAERLWAGNKTASIAIDAAAVPAAGQSLTATSSSVAVWRYPQIPFVAAGTSSEDSFVCISGTPQDITGSTVTIVTAGTYKFDWSSYVSSSVAGSDLQMAFYINGTVVLNSIRKMTPSAIGGKIPISTFCLISVAPGDVVKIQVATAANMTITCGYRTIMGTYVSV